MAEKGVEGPKGDVSAHSHEAQKSGHHQASDLGSANFGTHVLNHCTIWPEQMIGKKCDECRVTHTPLGIRLCVLYHNPGLPASQLSINLWGPSSSRSGTALIHFYFASTREGSWHLVGAQ